MVKSIIDSRGTVNESGDGFEIEGKSLQDAAFDLRIIDLFGDIHEGTGPAALTYEGYRDTGLYMRFFRHNQDDKIFMVYQMHHGWNHGTIYPHMHYIGMASGSGNVYFTYQYSWGDVETEIPAGGSWTTGSVTVSLTPADQYIHQHVAFGAVDPPVSMTGSSGMFLIAVQRLGKNVLDTYSASKDSGTAAANVAILYFDTHIQMQNAGTKDPWG